jgi:hypothetical protein
MDEGIRDRVALIAGGLHDLKRADNLPFVSID